MATPMSDERLAEAREFWAGHGDGDVSDDRAVWQYIHRTSTDLLDEVARLRARVAELEEQDNRVQAMADRMAEQAADNLLRAREAERRVARLKDVLRSVEWGNVGACPYCCQGGVHRPDCALDAALRDASE